jgi:hypothetical protein
MMCALRISTNSQQPGFGVPVCFATQSGGTTIDRDSEGGNPFATALIGLSTSADVEIADFPSRLRELTSNISNGHQSPEWIGAQPVVDWRVPQPQIGQNCRRVALVLIVSDYRDDLADLGGAAWDGLRISAMLARNGFSVTQGVGPGRTEMLQAIQQFGEMSNDSDFAIIYSTGHGREAEGIVYLLPGDYPIADGFEPTELAKSGISVSMLADACSARTMNLVFFAGCRST